MKDQYEFQYGGHHHRNDPRIRSGKPSLDRPMEMEKQITSPGVNWRNYFLLSSVSQRKFFWMDAKFGRMKYISVYYWSESVNAFKPA